MQGGLIEALTILSFVILLGQLLSRFSQNSRTEFCKDEMSNQATYEQSFMFLTVLPGESDPTILAYNLVSTKTFILCRGAWHSVSERSNLIREHTFSAQGWGEG